MLGGASALACGASAADCNDAKCCGTALCTTFACGAAAGLKDKANKDTLACGATAAACDAAKCCDVLCSNAGFTCAAGTKKAAAGTTVCGGLATDCTDVACCDFVKCDTYTCGAGFVDKPAKKDLACGAASSDCTNVKCCDAACSQPTFLCGAGSLLGGADAIRCGATVVDCNDAKCCGTALCTTFACGAAAGLKDKANKDTLACGAMAAACDAAKCCDVLCSNAGFTCAAGTKKAAAGTTVCGGLATDCTDVACCDFVKCDTYTCGAGFVDKPAKKDLACGAASSDCTNVKCCDAACSQPTFLCGAGSLLGGADAIRCGATVVDCNDAKCCGTALCTTFACGAAAGLKDKANKDTLACGATAAACDATKCCDASCSQFACTAPQYSDKPSKANIACSGTCTTAVCCDAAAAATVCSAYECGAGFVNKTGSDTIACGGTPPVCTDETCCMSPTPTLPTPTDTATPVTPTDTGTVTGTAAAAVSASDDDDEWAGAPPWLWIILLVAAVAMCGACLFLTVRHASQERATKTDADAVDLEELAAGGGSGEQPCADFGTPPAVPPTNATPGGEEAGRQRPSVAFSQFTADPSPHKGEQMAAIAHNHHPPASPYHASYLSTPAAGAGESPTHHTAAAPPSFLHDPAPPSSSYFSSPSPVYYTPNQKRLVSHGLLLEPLLQSARPSLSPPPRSPPSSSMLSFSPAPASPGAVAAATAAAEPQPSDDASYCYTLNKELVARVEKAVKRFVAGGGRSVSPPVAVTPGDAVVTPRQLRSFECRAARKLTRPMVAGAPPFDSEELCRSLYSLRESTTSPFVPCLRSVAEVYRVVTTVGSGHGESAFDTHKKCLVAGESVLRWVAAAQVSLAPPSAPAPAPAKTIVFRITGARVFQFAGDMLLVPSFAVLHINGIHVAAGGSVLTVDATHGSRK